jgi:hypothetical protein
MKLIVADDFDFIVFKNGNIVVDDGDVIVGVFLFVGVEGDFIVRDFLIVKWRLGWRLVSAASTFTTGEGLVNRSSGADNERT